MEKVYGKPVDPRQFKQDVIEDLESKAETAESRAARYRERADIEVNSCPICQGDDADRVHEMYGCTYVQCASCSHVYQTRILSEDALVAFYEENTDYASTYTSVDQLEYRLENITKPKIDFVRERADANSGRWLDVGCGVGTSIRYLEDLGWDAVGLEVSEDSVNTAAELLDVRLRQQTLEEYLTAEDIVEFDVVTMFGYLDLVPDPMADLRRVSETTRPGGTVAVHVPRFPSVAALVQRAFPDMAFRYLIWNVFHAFTTDSIQEAYDRHGFDTEAAWYYGLDTYELANTLSLAVEGFQDTDLYDYLLANFNEFQQTIDEDEMSDYMTVVGRKRR